MGLEGCFWRLGEIGKYFFIILFFVYLFLFLQKLNKYETVLFWILFPIDKQYYFSVLIPYSFLLHPYSFKYLSFFQHLAANKIANIFNNQNIIHIQNPIHFVRNNAILSFWLILFTYPNTINFFLADNPTSKRTLPYFLSFKQISSWVDFLLGIIKKIIKWEKLFDQVPWNNYRIVYIP